jgi:hypothetical protein
MSATPPLDPVAIAVTVAGLLIGEKLAPLAGAYAVIVLAWLGGVIVGLYRREKTARMSTANFVAVTLILTLGLTSFVSAQMSVHFNIEITTLLFPVAFLIPAVGDSWIDIGRWAFNLAADIIRSRTSRGDQP